MSARRIRERCEQFARDENVYECWHPENGDYVKVDSLVSLYSELLAEKDAEIARWKARSWDDNVKFIAEAKENLLKEYIRLTELYGEQKHEIRKLKSSNQQLMTLAIRFAERLASMDKGSSVHWNDVDDFLKSPEAQAFLKEHQL